MGKINLGRVFVGGLAAGLVINVGEFILNGPILGEPWQAAMKSINRAPIGGQAIAGFVVLAFLVGIGAVYTYAAVRARYGAGPKTAVSEDSWCGRLRISTRHSARRLSTCSL
jgi:hypothetical protein